MTTDPTSIPDPSRHSDESIDLFELCARFLLQWRTFLSVALVLFLLGAAIIFSIKPLFEAQTSILPQSKEDSSNLASIFSGRSPGDVFLGLLASRSVQEQVIDRANLLDHYGFQSREKTLARLNTNSTFTVGKDTLVLIKVRDISSQGARDIADAYLEGLEAERTRMLQHEFDIHRRFFEQQLAAESDALATAERSLKSTQESTGIVQMDAQTIAGITAIANLRAQVTTLRVQLASVLLGASDQNPQVQSLRAQIAQLEAQQHALESTSAGGPGAAPNAKNMPALNLDYARRLREVRYHEALFNAIENQFEVLKLSAGNGPAPFVIIDHAALPEQKAWPPRLLLVLLDAVLSAFLALVYVALLGIWRNLKADPQQQPRLEAIRNSFRRNP